MSPRIPAVLAALLLALPVVAQTPPPPPRPAAPAQPKPSAPPAPAPAASAAPRIDAAKQLYQQGKLLQSADELQAAVTAIYSQLGKTYGQTLPPAPAGWVIDQPDPQRLALMGGDASGMREYKPNVPPPAAQPQAMAPGQPGQPPAGPPRMNARIVLDGEAIRAMTPLFGPTLPPGTPPTVRKVRIGAEDALVAYDPNMRAGEVSILVGGRILLQVEGEGVANADPMIQTMQAWKVADLKRLAGLQ
ncbi:MAG: hypothetical protein IT563_16650 [Alphaproteobacteria bacterium]|nr:hypothetical protein [Alphaproteobacteria bacterium]